ncbi:MAG: hypothetical protein ABI443_04095 [Chthoniobacterales bacterium]
MKEKFTSLLALALLFAFSGCTISRNPLSSPKTAKPDTRLLGNWQSTEYKDDAIRITNLHGPWMRMEEITPKTLKAKPQKNSDAFYTGNFYPTTIDLNHFLNVQVMTYNSKHHREECVGYTFVRYEIIKTNNFVSWSISNEEMAKIVNKRKLKGRVQGQNVFLNASSNDLVRFLRTTNLTTLFKHRSIYRKIQ